MTSSQKKERYTCIEPMKGKQLILHGIVCWKSLIVIPSIMGLWVPSNSFRKVWSKLEGLPYAMRISKDLRKKQAMLPFNPMD